MRSGTQSTWLNSSSRTYWISFSFLIPSDLVPGRMSLLITTLLMLINISSSARENSPVSDTFSLIDLWLLTCTIFVAMALFEYAIVIKIRYTKRSLAEGHSQCTRVSPVTNYEYVKLNQACILCRSSTESLSTCSPYASHFLASHIGLIWTWIHEAHIWWL